MYDLIVEIFIKLLKDVWCVIVKVKVCENVGMCVVMFLVIIINNIKMVDDNLLLIC